MREKFEALEQAVHALDYEVHRREWIEVVNGSGEVITRFRLVGETAIHSMHRHPEPQQPQWLPPALLPLDLFYEYLEKEVIESFEKPLFVEDAPVMRPQIHSLLLEPDPFATMPKPSLWKRITDALFRGW